MMSSNWRVIPREVVEEIAEEYEKSEGEILYMIANDELPEDMADTLDAKIANFQREE